jgi:hypothetical protein
MRLVLVALLLVAATPPASGAPREPCTSLKTMAAGTEAAAKLRCQAKATSAGAGVSPHCVARAEAKLRAAFGRAERGGGCGTTGDATTVATLVDTFVSAVARTVLPGTSRGGRRCAAAELTSTGKTAARGLACHAHALRTGVPVAAACLEEASLRFARAVRDAENKGDCAATGDEASLDGAIEAFTAAVVATVTAPGSVTTTTTTIAGTTSSSTTTPGTPSTTTTSTTLGRTVSFRTEVQPIFVTRCALPLCHTGPLPQAGLSFMRPRRSFADLVGFPSIECPSVQRVLPGSPAGSYLITKLQGTGPCFTGLPMPNGGPPLPASELNTIIQWIAEGAPDN